MGSFLSHLLSTKSDSPPSDKVDDGTGLTGKQKKAVRDTWEIVKKDVKGNGVELFIKLFEAHPDYQQYFRAFADVPIDELRTNKRLLAHATTVMYTITALVDNLDDPDCLTELLIKTAYNHYPRKITAEHFKNLSVVIVALLEEKLTPNKFPAATKEAWEKLLDVVNSVVGKGLTEAAGEAKTSANGT